MPAVYAAIASDEPRNDLIFDDALKALEAKRSPIVLTERKDHLEYLQTPVLALCAPSGRPPGRDVGHRTQGV